MKQTIKGVILGAAVAAGVSVLLAQTPSWTTPRTWATDDLLTAGEFNQQFRDNLLWLRQDATLTGTAALDDLGCGTRGSDEVLYSDCDWAAIPAAPVFDIHDDVTQSETIANADLVVFSDESSAGDPMRHTTAANFANYAVTIARLGCSGTPSANTFLFAEIVSGRNCRRSMCSRLDHGDHDHDQSDVLPMPGTQRHLASRVELCDVSRSM